MRARNWVLTLALLSFGCKDPADQAAKKRVFSPEDPPKEKLAAARPIDAAKLAQSPESTERVLTMGAGEALERLGPHRFSATAAYEWKLGNQTVKLSETRSLDQAADDSYAVKVENDDAQGIELVHTEGRTFARSKFLKFRERKRDRGQAELLREDTFSALRAVSSVLDNRLGLMLDGQESVNGRTAYKYAAVLLEKPLSPKKDEYHLPPVQFATAGADPGTKRRLDFLQLKKPQSVEGAVWVDAQTGVPLKAALTARATAPSDEANKDATLTLRVQTEVKDVGVKPEVKVPTEYQPDEDRPGGVAAALSRFEVERQSAGDAGVPAAPGKKQQDKEDEPADDDQ